MKTLTYPLPDGYTGIAEIDDGEVILYIEEPTKIFFGLIDYFRRCTHFEVYTLSDKDDDRGIEQIRSLHGRISRHQLRYRNIDTFNPLTELERMYATYREQKTKQDNWNKRVKTFENESTIHKS